MPLQSFISNVKSDKVIWTVVFLLSIFSLLAVYSSTGTLAYRFQQGNTEYYLLKHFSILVFGLLLMYLAHLVPSHLYGQLSPLAMLIVIPILLLTLLHGTEVNQASRWYTLPIINVSFQPSDFAKLTVILFLARMITLYRDILNKFINILLIIVLPVMLIIVLILPANLSTALMILTTSIVIMYVAKIKFKYLIGSVGIITVLLAVLLLTMKLNPEKGRFTTWQSRIESFTGNNDEDRYQIEQSKIAIASGGFLGKLPGNSTQKNFLPQPYSDFIFAIIVEEFGTVGGGFLVFLYLVLLFRGIRLATKADNLYVALLAFGLSFSLVLQALIHMGVVVSIFPVTGQPLPMVSMGGTSLWFSSISIGILLSISRKVEGGVIIQQSDEQKS